MTLTSNMTQVTALSPLDGRYAAKLATLRPLMSEQGYMHRRVQVELAWFSALSDAGFTEFRPLSADARKYLIGLAANFSTDDALAIMLDTIITKLRDMAHVYADVPMLSRTHGQTASPTTVGKEIANVVMRLRTARDRIAKVAILAKMNGAVGNYNAHLSAWPEFDWEEFSKRVVETPAPVGLGLSFQPSSIHIEPHDYMAELFDAIARTNTILIDWSRDVWGYVSLGYFKQSLKAGEIGSSTMPHKVNPIDFENAEGNLGLANALLKHLGEKLPISRWQRDLTDSTVLRNMGVAIGYSVLAYQSLGVGLNKLEINHEALAADLDAAWEVLAEPIQTVMRRYGVEQAYEQLKEATRGKSVTPEALHGLVRSLPIPPAEIERLLAMTPASYIGKAAELARRV